MTVTRYKHIITTVDTEGNTDAKVFPSVNEAKRFNRTKLGGKATVVARRPKNGATHTQNNARCVRE